MKLQDELPEMIKRFNTLKDRIGKYASQLKESGEYKDFETRLAWDCFTAVYNSAEACDLYDKYNCNDTHIDTAVKIALKSIYTINK